jgi:hypothetical protein
MGEIRNAYQIFARKPERKRHTEDLGVDGNKILELILVK